MALMTLALMYLLTSTVNTCLTSSEEYAVEVVIPNSDLTHLINYDQRIGDRYFSRSEYNPNVIAIIGKTELPSGLSIRLQLPTITRQVSRPHISLVSYSTTGTQKKSLPDTFNGWQIKCDSNSCVYSKDQLSINAPFDKQEGLVLEINRALASCSSSCSGICFEATTESKCVDLNTRRDVEELMRYANLTNSFQDLFLNYRIQGSEEISVTDITSETNFVPDWQEAMRQELVALQKEKVILITRNDIEDIISLVKQGQSGQNYRIVYSSTLKGWTYYSQLESADLTLERDCNIYSIPRPSSDPQLSAYYLIPLLIIGLCTFGLALLIVIARIINPKVKKSKKKHLNISRN